MVPRDVLRSGARFVLLACLVAINAIPFFTGTGTEYDRVFLVWSAIHAELCLVAAWGLLSGERGRNLRWLWCLLATTVAVVAATRLLPGKWIAKDPWGTLWLGMAATLPALVPMAGWFAVWRYRWGMRLVLDAAAAGPGRHYRLRQLFSLIAGCAFLSLLLRLAVQTPAGWLASPPDASAAVLAVVQSLVIGLLAGPCAQVVLKPNRQSPMWLAYFVAVMAVQPILEAFLRGWFERPVGLAADRWIWPDSYSAVVIGNVTWYGPQLLPTAALFLLLRLAGARVQEGK